MSRQSLTPRFTVVERSQWQYALTIRKLMPCLFKGRALYTTDKPAAVLLKPWGRVPREVYSDGVVEIRIMAEPDPDGCLRQPVDVGECKVVAW